MTLRLKTIVSALALSGLLAAAGAAFAYEAMVGPTGVLLYDKDKAFAGYTVLSPTVKSTVTYLIDMDGNVVHEWQCQYPAGLYAELLPNGNLLRGGKLEQKDNGFGGIGGIVQEIDWDGKVVWEYKLADKDHYQHHTFHRMPSGNTLILAWERKSKEEARAKGRDPKTIPAQPVVSDDVAHNDFWVDFVREVDRDGKTVWEWHAWDHIGQGPKKLDINYHLPQPTGDVYPNFDWTHYNTVGYLPQTDQILLNSRNFSEFYLIDHKTGEIEYRWGNPAAYGAGKAPSWYDDGDQQVFGEHCVTPLDNGHILLFDNGSERPQGNRSRVVEMDPKTGKVVWEYATRDINSFFSYRQGGVQKLPNGNVLVTSTHHGHLFEVTPDKKVVWDYVSPIALAQAKCALDEDHDSLPGHHKMMSNAIHRAYRYGPDYPGLAGRDLSPKAPLAPGCPQFRTVYASAPAAKP